MTWKRAALYWLGALLLAAFDRCVLESREGTVPPPAFVDVDRATVVSVDIGRAGKRFHATRSAGGWRASGDGGAAVPSDLVDALVDSLTGIPAVEVVAEQAANLADFGLDKPAITVTLSRRDGAPLVVRFGNINPSSTAMYAQHGDAQQVFLIGRNIGYYIDLLLPQQ